MSTAELLRLLRSEWNVYEAEDCYFQNFYSIKLLRRINLRPEQISIHFVLLILTSITIVMILAFSYFFVFSLFFLSLGWLPMQKEDKRANLFLIQINSSHHHHYPHYCNFYCRYCIDLYHIPRLISSTFLLLLSPPNLPPPPSFTPPLSPSYISTSLPPSPPWNVWFTTTRKNVNRSSPPSKVNINQRMYVRGKVTTGSLRGTYGASPHERTRQWLATVFTRVPF